MRVSHRGAPATARPSEAPGARDQPVEQRVLLGVDLLGRRVRVEPGDLLRAHDIALVWADNPGTWPVLDEATTDFRYVRLHGDTELYASGYTDEALDTWAERIGGWLAAGQDVYVYCDNDAKVRAPYDAMGLMERLGLAKPAP